MGSEEAKEMQKQAEEISTILKNSGYRAGLIALSKDVGTAINAFGTRKDALNTIYNIIENLDDKDKLILLSLILGIDLEGGQQVNNEN